MPNLDRFACGLPDTQDQQQKTLGYCACGCGEQITDGYVYVVCGDDYFVDTTHFMAYHRSERNWMMEG